MRRDQEEIQVQQDTLECKVRKVPQDLQDLKVLQAEQDTQA